MLGKPSDAKYEAEGGPTFKDCYGLLRGLSAPGSRSAAAATLALL